jgi:transposase
MQDMAAKRARPPEGSGSAVRQASQATERPKTPTRRVYTAEFKRNFFRELDELRVRGERGAVGALFRREGLNWATVGRWEKAREKAETAALSPKKRGRKPKHDPVADENERLRKHVAKLEAELRKAEVIIDVQKKLSLLLGVEMPTDPDKDGTP